MIGAAANIGSIFLLLWSRMSIRKYNKRDFILHPLSRIELAACVGGCDLPLIATSLAWNSWAQKKSSYTEPSDRDVLQKLLWLGMDREINTYIEEWKLKMVKKLMANKS